MKKTIKISVTVTRAAARRADKAKRAAQLRIAATASRDTYAAYRKSEAAKGRELPPVPSVRWWIKDEAEEQRAAEDVREEQCLQALAACF